MYGSGGEILINVMVYSTLERANKIANDLARGSLGTYFVTEFKVND
jgi:hypothetical protein